MIIKKKYEYINIPAYYACLFPVTTHNITLIGPAPHVF